MDIKIATGQYRTIAYCPEQDSGEDTCDQNITKRHGALHQLDKNNCKCLE